MIDLKAIYLTALERCAPDVLVQRVVRDDMPHDVVAIGKCAGALLDGVAAVHPIHDAFVALPDGYPRPFWGSGDPADPPGRHDCLPHTENANGTHPLTTVTSFERGTQRSRGAQRGTGNPAGPPTTQNCQIHIEIAVGGHPHMTRASFEAGRRLVDFVDAHDDIFFLISGGGSACVEVPRAPHTEAELIETNARLIASGKSIGEINAIRKELSAIKGGRLAERVRGRCVTLVYSDVGTGALHDVASGPTICHPEPGCHPGCHPERSEGSGGAGGTNPMPRATRSTRSLAGACPERSRRARDDIRDDIHLIADNDTLTAAAAEIIGTKAILWNGQIESDVETAAGQLAERAAQLKDGEVLVAGGEPTVVVKGSGRGGRCCELAVRFARRTNGIRALFASSDGVDGNSGCAGIFLPSQREPVNRREIDAALAESDSFRVAAQLGEPIMIAPTGNNLRDLFLLARG